MADQRFFDRQGPFTLAQVAEHVGATIAPGADPQKQVSDVAPLDKAGPDDLSFFENVKYKDAFRSTAAGACITSEAAGAEAPEGVALLICAEPYPAYARMAAFFYPGAYQQLGRIQREGISPAAHVDTAATLGAGVIVEPGAVIGPDAEIGENAVIGANSVIGRGVAIGRDSWIGPNVTVTHALVGDRVTIHPGTRIGQDGFGFAMTAQGHLKVPQLGRVVIQDDVEIGANVAIDRGAGPDTVIGAGTKIDNLVQIGHNVEVGRGCVLVSQVGISGSTKLGDYVVAGGQVGMAGHVSVGSGAMLAARTGVTNDLPGGAQYGGFPAKPVGQWRREIAAIARLAKSRRKPG